MSTYLQLAAKLRQECGASGSGPTAVTNQTGEYKRLVEWIAEAYTNIQNKHRGNWRWLVSEFSIATVADDDEYAYTDATDTVVSATIARFARWRKDNLRIYLTSAGVATETFLPFMPWQDFRNTYKLGSVSSGTPACWSIDPRNNIRLGPKPSAIYTVTGEYHKGPQTLAANSDEPEMPAAFHQLIVYEAMQYYAAFESAPEVWQRAKEAHRKMMRDLEVDQLEPPTFGDPLC